jgi:hypothetical protein
MSPPSYCVIGAGPSGLTALKNLRQAGINAVCIEREDDVGGNWYYGRASSSVYDSTHLISSKRQTEYTDYAMPEQWPEYPGHRQVLEYLRGYAEENELREHIRFNTSVEKIERAEAENGWLVTISAASEPERYDGLVIANGHHWDPLLPDFAGEFAGEMIHARQYKTPDQLHGNRVLVVGAGNSGCDIAVEAAQQAASAAISMRRGYHFLPKFLLGKPIDQCAERLHRYRVPLSIQRMISGMLVRVAVGPLWRYGLPRPTHRLFESHPIINSQLPYFVGHGKIDVRPDVARLDGHRVEFTDGTSAEFELIICATGYKVSVPFLDPQHLNMHEGKPRLFLNAFHPQYDDLMIAGLIQPNSGQWGLTDLQCQLMARFITACEHDSKRAEWFRRQKSRAADLSAGIDYVNSPRHALEVEYFSYRRRLEKLIKKL